MAVWITGAHGFIGRHLARAQAQLGEIVVGIGHGAWPDNEAGAWGLQQWLNGDVSANNLLQLQRSYGAPSTIFHLAGGASVGAAFRAPREDFARTVGSTAELLEWMRLEAPNAALVAVSSAAVYGAGHDGPIAEDAPTRPCSPYGNHKRLMEMMCQSYAATYGLACAVPRLFSVYGAGLKKQLLWDLCNRLRSDSEQLQLGGSGAEQRDWIDVRDVVHALGLVASRASREVPIINVASGIATSVRDVAHHVSARSAKPDKRIVFDGRSPPGDPFSLVADCARLHGLGFVPAVSLTQGLADYVRWFLHGYAPGAP